MFFIYFVLVFIICSVIYDSIKYRIYMSKIKIGTKLRFTVIDMCNEFERPYTFEVTVIDIGKSQIKIMYSDKSTRVLDKMTPFMEDWKIVE